MLSAATQDFIASVAILAAALPLFVWPHLVDRIVAVYVCAVVAVGVVASI